MKALKLLVSVIMAMSALAAFAVSGAAASEFVGTFPDPFTATSGAGVLETTGGLKITCTGDTAKGSVTAAKEGTVSVDFTGCKSKGLGCRSFVGATKDPVETILIDNQKLTPVKIAAVSTRGGIGFKLAANLLINCGGVTDEVKGSVIGEVKEVGVKQTTNVLTFTQAAGNQTKVELKNCEEVKATCESYKADSLLGKLGAAFEPSGLETEEKLLFEKAIEFKI